MFVSERSPLHEARDRGSGLGLEGRRHRQDLARAMSRRRLLGEEVQESGDRTARTLGHDFDPPVGGVAGVADEPEFERSSPCPPPETHALHPPPHVDGHTDLLQTIAEGIKARLHDAMLGPSLPSAPP